MLDAFAAGSATVRAGDNQLDPKALVEWSEEEREELRFGSMVGLGYAGAVLAVYVRTMHPTVAGGDSGGSIFPDIRVCWRSNVQSRAPPRECCPVCDVTQICVGGRHGS